MNALKIAAVRADCGRHPLGWCTEVQLHNRDPRGKIGSLELSMNDKRGQRPVWAGVGACDRRGPASDPPKN